MSAEKNVKCWLFHTTVADIFLPSSLTTVYLCKYLTFLRHISFHQKAVKSHFYILAIADKSFQEHVYSIEDLKENIPARRFS